MPDSSAENIKHHFIGKSTSLPGSSPYGDCTSELIKGQTIKTFKEKYEREIFHICRRYMKIL